MYLSFLSTACLLLALVSSTPFADPEIEYATQHEPRAIAALFTSCPAGVQIIAARGTNQAPTEGPAMNQLATSIQAKIPNSKVIGVAYPAALTPTYEASESRGTANMTLYIENFMKKCPKSMVVLVGFSQGAQVVMDTLCGTSSPAWPTQSPPLPAAYRANILAAVVYGDPTHKVGMTYNHGTAKQDGIFARPNARCWPFAQRMSSFCDVGDPYCASGNDIDVHYSYRSKYNTAAVNFVTKFWKSRKN